MLGKEPMTASLAVTMVVIVIRLLGPKANQAGPLSSVARAAMHVRMSHPPMPGLLAPLTTTHRLTGYLGSHQSDAH